MVTNEIGGDFGFAAFAALEAEAFERQYTCSLQCIQAQYDHFLHLSVTS